MNREENLSDLDMSHLCDMIATASSLKLITEDYISQAEEHQVELLELPAQDYKNLLALSQAIEASYGIPIAHSGIWSH